MFRALIKIQIHKILSWTVYISTFFFFGSIISTIWNFQLYKEAEACLQCISNRLSDSEFFFGNVPSSLDAFVYGYLATLLKTPVPNSRLHDVLNSYQNLLRYVVRINLKYFNQELEGTPCYYLLLSFSQICRVSKCRKFIRFLCSYVWWFYYIMIFFLTGNQFYVLLEYETKKQKESPNRPTDSASDLAFPNRTRDQILAALIAIIAMTSYGVMKGIFSVSIDDEK